MPEDVGFSEEWLAAQPIEFWLLLGRDVVLAFFALVLGLRLGRSVTSTAATRGLDRLLEAPWTPPPTPKRPLPAPFGPSAGAEQAPTEVDAPVDPTLSRALGAVARYGTWLAGAWALSELRGWPASTGLLRSVVPTVALVTVVGLLGWAFAHALSRTAAQIVRIDLLRRRLDLLGTGGGDAPSTLLARVLGLTIHGAVFVVLLTLCGSSLGWAGLSAALEPLWSLASRFLTAGSILLLGWLGTRWLSFQPGQVAQTPSRIGQVVGIGALFFAMLALTRSEGTAAGGGTSPFWFVLGTALAVGAVFLWPYRTRLKDVWAGIQLRSRRVNGIPLPRGVARIVEVEMVSTRLRQGDREWSLPNGQALALLEGGGTNGSAPANDSAARGAGAPVEASPVEGGAAYDERAA